jgi:hypothetical protein
MKKTKEEQHEYLTRKHIRDVRKNIKILLKEISLRAKEHDKSKLESPEKEIFAEANPKLAKVKYGSPDYEEMLKTIKPALEHHYSQNRHHPEHWPQGINDMDIVDLLEMLVDWAAASKRNLNGNIHRSIEANTQRFNISEQLKQILTNTVERYFK